MNTCRPPFIRIYDVKRRCQVARSKWRRSITPWGGIGDQVQSCNRLAHQCCRAYEREPHSVKDESAEKLGQLHGPSGGAGLLRTKSAAGREKQESHVIHLKWKRNGLAAQKTTTQLDGESTDSANFQSENISKETRRRLSLLRSLLREVTYLPDPASRLYLRSYILGRYRTFPHGESFHATLRAEDEAANDSDEVNGISSARGAEGNSHLATKAAYENTSGQASGAEGLIINGPTLKHPKSQLSAKVRGDSVVAKREMDEVQPHRLARKGLRLLQLANEGYPSQLLRTLLLTYGRTGARRFKLLQPLLRPDAEEQIRTDPLRESVKTRLHPNNVSLVPHISAPLVALLRSQYNAKISNDAPHAASRLKKIELDIPLNNAYMRPMPQRRAMNMIQSHRASLFDRVLAPVSDAEFNMLATLASPETKEEKFKTLGVRLDRHRRRRGVSSKSHVISLGRSANLEVENQRSNASAELDVQCEDYKDETERVSQASVSSEVPENLVLELQSWPRRNGKPQGKERAHTFTKRWMRRLYATVFQMTPTMAWDSENKRWNVRWGKPQTAKNDHLLVEAIEREIATANEDLERGETDDGRVRAC